MLKVTAKDVKGVVSMPPTPCKDNGGGWQTTDSVDLDRTNKLVNILIDSGVSAFAFCGTTGENAALLFDEKKAFIAGAVQANKHRIPIFAGATNLGTKDVIRQARILRDVGADGLFLGLPLWQTPTLENSVRYFADVAEAVPDMPILVYSNSMFFKTDFPVEFWAGLAKTAPTVVTNKIAYGLDHIDQDVKVSGHQIKFVPGSLSFIEADKKAPGHFNACWSTGYAPEPYVAAINAFNNKDTKRLEEIVADIHSVPPFTPPGGMATPQGLKGWAGRMESGFAHYNAQVHKWEWKHAGYLDIGPMRAPYTDLPDDWKKAAETHVKVWMEMRKKYVGVKAG